MPITFKELLNHSTGKANATRQEFESAMASRGYKSGDVRKLGKAYDRVKESGNEYVLHDTKGFNVYDPENKQLTGSGKKKGNKAGFDLGDLIGLGGDVSLLAGALRNEVKGFNESRAPKTTEVKPEPVAEVKTATTTPSAQTTSKTTNWTPKQKSSGVGSQASKSGGLKEPKDFDLSDFIKAPESQAVKGPEISNNFFGEPTLPATTPKKKAEASGFNWGEALIGDASKLFDVENYKDLAALYNPAKLFSQPIADWSNNRLTRRAQQNQEQWETENPGEDYNKRMVSAPVPNLGLLTPFKTGRSRNLGAIPKTGPSPKPGVARLRLGQGARQMNSSYPASTPKLLNEHINPQDIMFENITDQFPNHKLGGRMTEYKDGGLIPDEINYPVLRTNGIGELVPTEEGEILMSASKGAKLTPDEINYPSLRFNDIGELVPTEEGEILLSGRKGLKLGYKNGGRMKDMMLYGKDGIQFNIDDSLEAPVRGVRGGPDTSLFDWNPNSAATQQENTVGANITPEGNVGKGKAFDWSNVASGLTKYGIPAAYLGAEQAQIHNLRKLINPHLTAPELMTGAVKDLPHPDFSLPYQPGMEGSSLGESQASGLSRAKFQRENQNQWELKNALNRQEQQNHIIDRLNQNAILKSQTKNQEEMIKSGNAMNEFGYLLQDRGQTAGSLFQNLDAGITGGQIAKDRNATLAATHIIENANSSPEDVAWAKEVLGITKTRKKGGKLSKAKTKFSYA